ncbi:MAG: PTS sugar transporter subunit IIB [Gemmatimonadota bacterium]|nr:MAG: PTS sugar transporter subunit IIB [Gemmatimonadota bacterium]
MSLKLVRLDDRLIHGQVVVGWGNAVAADRILLIDDDVAANDWERELYAMGVPPEMEVAFATVDDCVDALEQSVNSKQRTIVLVGDVNTLVRVCDATDVVKRVNIGGIHEGDGRAKRLAYVFLTDEEVQALKKLEEKGIEVTARDVPTTKPIPLEDFA